MMIRMTLVTAIATVMALGATSAGAQMQQKGPEDKGGVQMQAPSGGQPQAQEKKGEPGSKSTEKAEPKEKTTKGAQGEPRDKATKGTAEKGTEPKDRGTKGTAEKATEPKEKTKGAAEKTTEPKDKATKGTAEKATEPKTKGSAEKSAEPKDKATKGAAEKGSAGRVQLSEQQRTNVGQTLLKDQRVNRATNVNITINVGTRVPRSVRLVALPATVISIVPEYRTYRYFVVDDRICIVDPGTYEIVEIITVSDRTAGDRPSGESARLALTEEEKSIILRVVDMGGNSTLALGSLTEGADVPRDIELRVFSETIVQKVPKVKDYKFFSAENRVAIVDPQGAKVQLVLEKGR